MQDSNMRISEQVEKYDFSFIPIEKRGKKPLISWTEFQKRKPTEAEALEWHKSWPDANYGIVTGMVSGVVVLDIDDMDAALPWIEENGGLPRTPCVRTAKGKHYYFRNPAAKIRNAVKKHGCDFRGEGGYVVAPGSIHESGVLYKWIVSPDEAEFSELPAWITEALRQKTPLPDSSRNGSTPYGRKALENECSTVQTAAEGTRNHTLNIAAVKLGSLVSGGELDRGEAEAELLQAARSAGLPDREARKTINSGITKGIETPRRAPAGNNGKELREETRTFAPTEMGNGERFAAHNAGKALYDHTSKHWLVWDGMRWTPDDAGTVKVFAKKTARDIVLEIRALPDEAKERREALHKHAMYSEKEKAIRAMLSLAESEPQTKTNHKELDVKTELFNLKNGTLELDTCTCREHRPADKITKVSPVVYDAKAGCPTWTEFLNRIFEKNTETIFYVKQMAGYILTADISEQCFFLLHGTGANGKSTFVNTLLHIMGDYGLQSDFSTFMLTEGKKWELADFKGARLVAASEGERGQRLAESMVKAITGGEKIKGERKYGNPFTFMPEFKLLLSTNHKPRVTGTDLAIWRRMRLIPFNVTIPENEQDPYLPEKLIREAPGILNWMLQGLQSWQEKRLIQPDAVTMATAEYRGEQDTLNPFIEECCTIGENERAELGKLYERYQQYAQETGERAISRRALSERLTEHGFQKHRSTGGVKVFTGLSLKIASVT